MAGGGPGSHGSTKQNYDLDQIWGDLREGIEHVSIIILNKCVISQLLTEFINYEQTFEKLFALCYLRFSKGLECQ